MSGLQERLADAVDAAERVAPDVDPVGSLRARRRHLRERRRAAVTLAFVAFVLLVQAVPHPALGVPPTTLPVAAAAEPASPRG